MPHRRLVVHLAGDRTESLPVSEDFEIPIVASTDLFVHFECADGSEVAFRQEHILTMHLKDS